MTKQKAIRKFCLACCETSKDVALCTDLDCHLWPYRLGFDLKSKGAIQMMERIHASFPDDISDLKSYGVDPALYLPRPHQARSKSHRTGEPGQNTPK